MSNETINHSYTSLHNLAINFPLLKDEYFKTTFNYTDKLIFIDIIGIPYYAIHYILQIITKHNLLKSILDLKPITDCEIKQCMITDFELMEFNNPADLTELENSELIIRHLDAITFCCKVKDNLCPNCVSEKYNVNSIMVKSFISKLIDDELKSLGLWNPIVHSKYPTNFKKAIFTFLLSCYKSKQLSNLLIHNDIILHKNRMNLFFLYFK